MSTVIASVIALVVVGALAALVLPRVLGAAAGEEGRATSENPKRSLLLFLGMGAAAVALLTNVAGLVAAFYDDEIFAANAFPTAFIGLSLGFLGYFLGARKLGIAAVIVTVLTLAVGSVVVEWL